MVLSLQKIKIYGAVFLLCYMCYFILHFILSTRNTSCMVSERESKRAVLLKDESFELFYRHIINQRKIRQQKSPSDFKMELYRDPRWWSRKPKLQLLLLSYKNAGSTYLGNLLRQNGGVFYVYHPVAVLLDYIEEYRGERMYLYKKLGEACGPKLADPSHRLKIFGYLPPISIQISIRGRCKGSASFGLRSLVLSTDAATIDSIPINQHHIYFRGLRRKDLSEHRARNLTTEGNETMSQLSKDLVNNFLDCNFTELDIASLTNLPYFHDAQTRNFSDCIRGGSLVIYIKCLKLLYEACNNTDVTLVNVVQLPIKIAKSLLIQKPELKLIYLYRDPRATLWTQFNNGVYKWGALRKKAEFFCNSLLKDVMVAQNITKMFPNRFLSIKYEDLVNNIKDTFRSMHKILGIGDMSKDLEDYITSGKRILGCSDCVQSDHNAWRMGIPYVGAGMIDMHCARVYKKLGYKLISGQQYLRNMNETLEYHSNFP